MNIKITKAMISIFIVVFTIGCASSSKQLLADLSEQQLNQRAQELLDKGRYKAAEKVYLTLRDRYGDNPASRVSCEFELAHILIKQKKWQAAREKLLLVLTFFEENISGLPNEYKKLAEIDLEKANKKLKLM